MSTRASSMIQRGVTLVELLVTITVIAVAGMALLGTLGYLAGRSGEALGDTQAQAVADAYLARTLAQPFASVSNATFTQGPFNVSVVVASSAALPNVPATDAKRVDVTVTGVGGRPIIATGYRLFP